MKKNVKQAQLALFSSHKAVGRAMKAVGHEHGDATHQGDATRSRRLSAALGAMQRAAELVRDAQRELKQLDQAQADALPSRPAKASSSKPAEKAKAKRR